MGPGARAVPPTLGFTRIIANALSRNEGRAELALHAALEHGDVVRLPMPGKRVFLVTGPAALRRVMIQNASNYRKSFDYRFLAKLLGEGLITSEGELWQRDRRLQHPLFHGKQLDHFFATILRCSEALVDSWKPGQVIKLEDETARFAFHVIGERIASVDVRDAASEIAHHMDVCQRHIVARALALVDVAKWVATPGERRFRRSLSILYALVDDLIERRRKLEGSPYDLYSVLTENPYPPERLRDQFLTLFMVGHETSAIALTWLYYALSGMPEVDARVAAESRSALAGGLTFAKANALPYTAQVLQETMRLYPPVSFMGREAIADDELGGFPIPKDSIVVLCPYATHRRPDLWPDPERFDPSRFSEEADAARPPCAYLPFAAGPRGCIGAHFAMLELQIAACVISARYRLRLTSDAPVGLLPLVSTRPTRSIEVELEPRAPSVPGDAR